MKLFGKSRRPSGPNPLTALANSARRLVSSETGPLSEPIGNVSKALEAAPESDVTRLVSYGIFNPFGPTLNGIDLVRVSETDEALLTCTMLNPFKCTATVYALLPAATRQDAEAIERTLRAVALRNGHDKAPILGQSAPTFIDVPDKPVVEVDNLRAITIDLLKAAGIEHIGETAERLERFDGRPWDRATEELDIAAAQLVENHRNRVEASTDRIVSTQADYERYWKIAANRAHVISEMSQMQTAWEGALRFSGGM